MIGPATESLLAAGYGLFLVLVALGIDALARHSHRRSELYRTGGFTYFGCPTIGSAPRGSTFTGSRPTCSTACPLPGPRSRVQSCPRWAIAPTLTMAVRSPACSTRGHTPAGRFHRGIAIAIVGFGILVIGAGAALHHGAADLLVLGAGLLVCAVAGLYMTAGFRSGALWIPLAGRRAKRPGARASARALVLLDAREQGGRAGVPDSFEPVGAGPWYRFGTRCTVLSVQIVHGPGHIGNDGRSETHRRLNPLGWGPKGRWFKSSRPD